MNQKFPSSNEPRFQNEAKWEDKAYLHKGENSSYIKDFALSLALRNRLEVTQTTDLS